MSVTSGGSLDLTEILREIFRHTPVGVVLLDLHGTILEVNEASCSLVGHPRDQVVGRDISLFLASEDVARAERYLAGLREGETGSQRLVHRLQTREEDVISVTTTLSVVRTGDGESVFCIAFIEDISERLRMENALRESESVYRQLFHNLPVAVWETDWSGILQIWRRDGVDAPEKVLPWLQGGKRNLEELAALRDLREVNQHALRLAAAPDFEAFRRWTLAAIRTEDGARVVPMIASVILGQQPAASVEMRVERCDGVMIDIELELSAQEGNTSRIISAAVDVTEKKRIEGELLHSQMLLEHAQSIAHIGSWEVNFERDELFASREYWNILDGSGNGPRRRRLSEALLAIHPDDRAGVVAAMQRGHENFVSGAGRGEESYEFRIVRGEGTRLASGQASFSRTPEGEFRGYGILRDITEQRKAEEAAQRQREELARADRMISLGVLVSGVAHEINNPNHLIMLNTPLLRAAWSDVTKIVDAYAAEHEDLRIANLPWAEMRGEFAEVIDEISEGSERIRAIVAELRGFGRDQQPTERRPTSINDVIQRSLRLLGNHIRKATTRFTLELSDDLPPVEANSQRLEQVVVNLVINSCQALERPDAAVLVRTSFDRANGRVEIRVIDEGRGIPPENLPKIRDPFFTTKRSEGGTGLGLAVSERIVLEHNGTLTFVSEPGAGTTATLSIPAASGN